MRRIALFGPRLKRESRPAATFAALALLLAVSTLAIGGYRFGVHDQGQYLVQVQAIEHPAALTADPYADVFSSLGSVFWQLFAMLSTESNRAAFALMATIAVVLLNIVLLAKLMSALAEGVAVSAAGGGGRHAATSRFNSVLVLLLPALLLVVPKERNWFGLVWLSDVELTATLAVMPLVFAAMWLWTIGRVRSAWIAAACAVFVQGQVGAYLLSALFVATLWCERRNARAVSSLAAIACLGVLTLAVARLASWLPADELARYELIGLGLNAPLINPLLAPLGAWAGTFAVIALGAAAMFGLARRPAFVDAAVAGKSTHRRLMVWCVATLVFPALGLIALAAGAREPLLWKLMVGRSFMLPQLGAIVFVALWIAGALRRGGIASAAGAVVLIAIVLWPFATWSKPAAALGLGGIVALIVMTPVIGSLRTALPSADCGSRLTAFGIGNPRWAVTCAILAITALAAHALLHQQHPWLRRGESDAWLAAQQWARSNTREDAIFITPPYRSGWRVGAVRASFGEIKDGGLSFYAGRPVLCWADRMKMLGMNEPFCWIESAGLCGVVGHRRFGDFAASARQAYRRSLAQNLPRIVRQAPIQYIVAERNADAAIGRLVWSNEQFVIRHLDAAALAMLEDAGSADSPAARLASLEPPRTLAGH